MDKQVIQEIKKMKDSQHYYTIRECADFLRCSQRTIWRCIASGKLKYHSFGSGDIRPKKLIPIDSINRMLKVSA